MVKARLRAELTDKQVNSGKLSLEVSWDGFFPPHLCKACGEELRGRGSGHPAELYAGTYTGLCYACTSAPAYVSCVYQDGAYVVSNPPSCPNYRRSRECFIAYVDCTACKGAGSIEHYNKYTGHYIGQCEECIKRYSSDPERQRIDKFSRDLQQEFKLRFQKELDKFIGKTNDEAHRKEIANVHDALKVEFGARWKPTVQPIRYFKVGEYSVAKWKTNPPIIPSV